MFVYVLKRISSSIILCKNILSCVVVFGLLSGCAKKETVQPRMAVPGYKAELIFEDTFDQPSDKWIVEGKGDVFITQDGHLSVTEISPSEGIALFAKESFDGDFHVEYEVEFTGTPGINIIILCAHTQQGEDIHDKKQTPRNGNLAEYSRGEICSYHISSHCFTPDGQHDPGTKVRKNPGHLLLAREEPDPCMENRSYFIDVVKTGNRIQYFVDGMLIHDVRDKGGFGPTYMKGKFGFWMHGDPENFTTRYDNFRVFELIPD